MRTTLDIEEDVLLATRELARRRGVSIGHALSDLAREALMGRTSGGMRTGISLFPISPGAGVVTPELINRLRDEAP